MNNNGKYDDIINMPHHVSSKHPQMSIEMRSAQFAPFSALTGYDEVVKETERLTNKRIDIDEELKKILDNKLQFIQEKILVEEIQPEVEFTYFVPDLKKQGGKYITVTGNVKKIDEYKHLVILQYNEYIMKEKNEEKNGLENIENSKENDKFKNILEIPIVDVINIELK